MASSPVDQQIAAWAAARPDAPAVTLRLAGRWHSWSRAQFEARVDAWARHFTAALGSGKLILFIKRLDLDLVTAFVGAMRAGHVPAQLSPPSPKLAPDEQRKKLDHVLATTGAQALLVDGAEAPRYQALPGVRALPDVGAVALLVRDGALAPALPAGAALVQFSSGSVGLQKGVAITHDALGAHAAAYAPALGLDERDCIVSWLPLYHDMGLIAAYLTPLMRGARLVLMDPFDWIARPDLHFAAIAEHGGTLSFLPNFAYHVLAAKATPRPLPTMRAFVNCSEPARPATHRLFAERLGVSLEQLTVCYALAENTFAVSQTAPGRPAATRTLAGRTLSSCGPVLPGTEVAILEPDGHGVGEIAIRGRSLAHPLWAPAAEPSGFYRTGDLGFVDGGELYVSGRKKDLIIVHGKNIHPQDVEDACHGVGGVYPGRVAAVGIDSEASGSQELYVLAERDGAAADNAVKLAVQRAVAAEVGILPRVIVLPHLSLAKTSSGKISRGRNKERFLAGELVGA
jgi:fatty-acyl-CoA synthase